MFNLNLNITRLGNQRNDASATHLQLGSPSQLTRNKVQTIQDCNAGNPFVNEVIRIVVDKIFTRQLTMGENDVCFIELTKQ
jgi:hypothetical protein